jgi:hypothetical protein
MTTIEKWEQFYRDGKRLHWFMGIMAGILCLAGLVGLAIAIFKQSPLMVWLPLLGEAIFGAFMTGMVIKNWRDIQPDCERIRKEIENEGQA